MKERELTCICCPLGCQITAVTENKTVVSVSGNHCPRGAKYAEAEILHPVRIVTTTVPVTGGTQPRVSVKTKKEIPKEKIMDCIRQLKDVHADAPVEIGDVLLDVRNVSSDYVKEVSFTLHKGEVLGFSGLVGAGRTEVMRAIIGADKRKTGEIFLEGKKIENRSPKEAMDNGIVLVPEDRKMQGILSNLSVSGNINIALMDQNANRLGIINPVKENEAADKGIRDFKVKTPSPDKKIVELSGGNQQKCIVARGIATNPKVLILDEPTKGIDVGAKSEFYNMICQFAKQGLGVILISSELPEVIGLSDRIIVMKSLRISGEVMREEATEDRLLQLGMMGEDTHEQPEE